MVTTADTLGGSLSELVRDSQLDVVFGPGYTAHPRAVATRREKNSHEKWIQQQNPVGKGGMGSVYVEVQEATGPGPTVLRAVKKIALTGNEEQKKMIRRELEALFKFSQPSFRGLFIQPYGWFVSEQYIHIAMEFCELGDLQRYIDNSTKCPAGRLPENEVGSIGSQILDALYMMHSHRFSHWDIKPANLLIKRQPPSSWLIKLGDFGISKRGETVTKFTSLGGTLDYMPPEHHGYKAQSGVDLSRAVDMWCLGQTLFRLMTGQSMFRDGQASHSFFRGQTPFPDSVLTDLHISEEGINFLRRLIVVDPSARTSAEQASRDPWIDKYNQQRHGAQDQTGFVPGGCPGQGQISHIESQQKSYEPSTAWPIATHSYPGTYTYFGNQAYPGNPPPFSPVTSGTHNQYPTQAEQTGQPSAAWPIPTQTIPSYMATSMLPPSTETFSPPDHPPPPSLQPPVLRSSAPPVYYSSPPSAAWPTSQTSPAPASFHPPYHNNGITDPNRHPAPEWSANIVVGGNPPPKESVNSALFVPYQTYAQSQISAAKRYFADGNYNQAKETYARLICEIKDTWGQEDMLAIDAKQGLAEIFILQNIEQETVGEIYREAMLFKTKALGPDDPETLKSMQGFAGALLKLDKAEQAEPICQEVFQRRMRLLGRTSMETVRSMESLAFALHDQEKYEAAERLFSEVVELRQSSLGNTHGDTLEAVVSMAVTLNKQDKMELAEPLIREALQTMRETVGSLNDKTAGAIHELGDILLRMQRGEESEGLFREAVSIRKCVLGPGHRDTLKSLHSLGCTLAEKKHFNDALPIFRQLVEIRLQNGDEKDTDTICAMSDLSYIFFELGQQQEALLNARRVVNCSGRLFITDDPACLKKMRWLPKALARIRWLATIPIHDEALFSQAADISLTAFMLAEEAFNKEQGQEIILNAMNDHVMLLTQTGINRAFEQEMLQALDLQKKFLGPDHRDTIEAMIRVAKSLKGEKRCSKLHCAKLEVLEREIVLSRKRTKGDNDSLTIEAINNLAGTLKYIGKTDEAEEMYKKVLEWRRNNLGLDHPDTVGSMISIAAQLCSMSREQEAKGFFDEVRRLDGGGAVEKSKISSCLAAALRSQGRHAEAEEYFRDAWLLLKGMKTGDGRSIEYMVKYAENLCYWQDKFAEGEPLLEKGIAAYTELVGENSKKTLDVMHTLVHVLFKQNKYQKAIELGKKLVRHREATEDNGSSDLHDDMSSLALNYRFNGQYSEAENWYQKVYNLQKQTLGNTKGATLQSLHELAEMKKKRGRYLDAAKLAGEAYDLRLKHLSDGSWKESKQLRDECWRLGR